MARTTVEAWLPEEYDSKVIQRVQQNSAIESLTGDAQVPMGSTTKSIPRSGSATVAVVSKGGTYGEDSSTNDDVVLTARKIGSAFRIAEEDIDDSLVAVVATKQNEWAIAYAKFLDNACLGVTAAANGTTVPFTSVYRALTTADASVGYNANDNVLTSGTNYGAVTITAATATITATVPFTGSQGQPIAIGDPVVLGTITTTTGVTAGTTYYVLSVPTSTTVTIGATPGGAALTLTGNGSATSFTRSGVGYDNLSAVLKKVESSDWFDPSTMVVIAHPDYKDTLRRIKDNTGEPIFVDAQNAGTPDTLFNYPIKYSLGAKTHATASSAPTGSPLLFFGNSALLRVGKRSGPESVFIDGRNGLGALTDESILKVRARRAFLLGNPFGFAVLVG